MTSTLKFGVFKNEANQQEGIFEYRNPIVEEFDDFLEYEIEGEAFSSLESIDKVMDYCSRLTFKAPDFLDAYSHAAGALFENDEVIEAKIWYERGLKQAYSVMPNNYKGLIRWIVLENRPFLRLHHGLIVCLCYFANSQEAIKECEKHLKWNPNDNLGVRYLLADIYTHDHEVKKARKLMRDGGEYYPPYHYNLALIHFRNNEYYEAITEARLGILGNPYIAEMLLGNDEPMTHAKRIFNGHEGIDTAQSYLDGLGGASWYRQGEAIAFLHWVYHASISLKDRWLLAELHQQLDNTIDLAARSDVISQIDHIKLSITLESSRSISLTTLTRHQEVVYAWLGPL